MINTIKRSEGIGKSSAIVPYTFVTSTVDPRYLVCRRETEGLNISQIDYGVVE